MSRSRRTICARRVSEYCGQRFFDGNGENALLLLFNAGLESASSAVGLVINHAMATAEGNQTRGRLRAPKIATQCTPVAAARCIGPLS